MQKNILSVKIVCFLLGNTVKFIEIFPKIIYNMYAEVDINIVKGRGLNNHEENCGYL